MQNMQVVKRDGRREDVAFEKVQERITKSSVGLAVNPTKVAQGVLTRLVDGITTTELDTMTAHLAYSWSTLHPDYGELAARIAISSHQKNTPPTFLEAVLRLDAVLDKTGVPASLLDAELVAVAREKAAEIEAAIHYDRDFLLDYFGFKTLEKAYLLRDTTRAVVERPQHLWMRVALGLWLHDLPKAFETYDLMSQKFYTHATPTLFNAGTKRPQLSSCFLQSMKSDSIRGIYDTLQNCALISQYGGGIGLHISNIRAQGSLIKGTGGVSNGIVPMMRVYNNTARYVDQCFTSDTMVRTESGVKRISDIVAGTDNVLTSGSEEATDVDGKHAFGPLNPRYCRVLRVVEHAYTGPLLQVCTRRLGVVSMTRVTPSHPALAIKADPTSSLKPEERLARGLASLDYYPMSELKVGDSIAYANTIADIPPIFVVITAIYTSLISSTTLYDLEVEDIHDYLVEGFGFAHNGGGKRNGSFAMYLEPWHADVEQFLEMKKNTGSEEERARDLFYALWIPDLFMERVDKNGEWTLFCPNEAPGLADVVGDEFVALYTRYEAEGRGRKVVKAQKLWFQILESQIETGTPYLLYKDAANQKSNQQNLGVIKSSNLCVAPETPILTDRGEFPIASLAGREVSVWNGDSWATTVVKQTSDASELLTVEVRDIVTYADGFVAELTKQLTCTFYHKLFRQESDGKFWKRCERVSAHALEIGDHLGEWFDAQGNHHCPVVRAVIQLGRVSPTFCFTEPINNAGVFAGILTGQCAEIVEYSSPEETAVCNLASMSLPAFITTGADGRRAFDFPLFRKVVKVAVRNLDRVIDVNYYPIPEAEVSNKRHRPVGLGIQGLADVFALLGLAWESAGAAELNRRIFAHMYYAALESSCDIAAAHGVYSSYHGSPLSKGAFQFDLWKTKPLVEDGLDWDTLGYYISRIGVRNSLLVAAMPTASTSQILGNCECMEPYATHIFTRRTLAGEFIVINKHLVAALLEKGLWTVALKDLIIANNGSVQGVAGIPEDIQALFKTVWEIKQKTLIDMAAERGPYICQSQSLNLFLGDPDYRKLTSMHFYAWRRGLKTGIYYLRTRAVASAQKFTVEPAALTNTVVINPAPAEKKEPVKEEEKECLMCSS
jgi:ribonucleotide reductase alpha subunit